SMSETLNTRPVPPVAACRASPTVVTPESSCSGQKPVSSPRDALAADAGIGGTRANSRVGWTQYTFAAWARSYQSFSTIPVADGGAPVAIDACPGPVGEHAYGRWALLYQAPPFLTRSNPSGPNSVAHRPT